MSDMVGHTAPRRMTSNYQENNWGRIMDGHAMMDKMAPCWQGLAHDKNRTRRDREIYPVSFLWLAKL